MVRGVNTEFIFEMPCHYTNLKSVQITFWQEGNNGPSNSRILPIVKDLGHCEAKSNPKHISVVLNSEETMRFIDGRKAYVKFIGTKYTGQKFIMEKEAIDVDPAHDDSAFDPSLLPTPNYNDWIYIEWNRNNEGE